MIKQLLIGSIVLAAVGCTETPKPTKQSKLLALASDETMLITDPRDRLTRELNFAYDQAGRGQVAEAKASLAHAAETLRGVQPKQLDSQKWIAGWVSISELSRGIEDTAAANSACDQAVALLRKLDPIEDRPKFAVGVAAEVKALHGPAASAKVLEESAPWTSGIKDEVIRRVALAQITQSIFGCDDYAGGLVALRTDPDAAWRSDTLKRFAEEARPVPTGSGFGAVGGVVAEATPAPGYSEPVDFGSVFRGRR